MEFFGALGQARQRVLAARTGDFESRHAAFALEDKLHLAVHGLSTRVWSRMSLDKLVSTKESKI